MLSDRCLSLCLFVCPVCPVCNVGVLLPNGWMDQDATSAQATLLDGYQAPPRERGTAAPPPLSRFTDADRPTSV